MEGKTGLIMGVANERSKAWGIANQLFLNKANIILTYQNDSLKKAFIESGGINPKYSFSEDYDFILKISKNYNVYFTKDTYSIYRVHNNNLSNKNFRKGYLESIDILSKYLPRFYSLLGIFINLFKYLASGILNKIKND